MSSPSGLILDGEDGASGVGGDGIFSNSLCARVLLSGIEEGSVMIAIGDRNEGLLYDLNSCLVGRRSSFMV